MVYNWIEGELKAAADKCPSKIEMGKINKYAAHMLLAKLYLNHNAWFKDDTDKTWYSKALDEVNKVIEGPFSLAPNYSDNFKEDISTLLKSYSVFHWEINMQVVTSWPTYGYTMGRARWNFSGWATGGIVFPQFLDTYEKEDTRMDNTWTGGQQYAMDGTAITVDGEPLVYTKGTP